jgi:hypothetical protein
MSTVDYNVNNYTITELLAILELEDPNSDEIIDSTNTYIERFSEENQPQLVNFFQSIQTKLLQYMEELETSGNDAEYEPNEEQTKNWIEYQALPQDDAVQRDKNTDRVQKIDVYDNNHVPMNREQLGVNNNFNVPVAQDTLNPNLTNVTTRFINLDSQFRQASGGSESLSTNYTMDLSDHLTNVLTLSLYSIQIPYTWYAIDYIYGNTCFWLTNADDTFTISVEPGNYSPTEFCNTLNNAFISAGFIYAGIIVPTPLIATFNSNNGKIKLNLTDWKDPNMNLIKTITQYTDIFNSKTDAYFTFFDLSGLKSCYETGTYACSASGRGQTFDGTLGWLMGYRLPIQAVFTGGNIARAVINLYGTKYFIMVLDDFNQNRINNGLVSITELSNSLPIPSYYNTSQPYTCNTSISNLTPIFDLDALGQLSNTSPAEAGLLGLNQDNLFNSLLDKLDLSMGNVQEILPSAPRTLTQAQIYTINEIIKNRSKTISFRGNAPTNSDIFAVIPIKYGSMATGQLYTELSGQFQDNKRIYFGPVDIDRLKIQLLNDRGNVVDLNGADWSITILAELLYQY